MITTLPARTCSFWPLFRTAVSVLMGFALSACKADEETTYWIYNYSGKPLMAGIVQDTSGGHSALEGRVPDRYVWPAGSGSKRRPGTSVTVEWTWGEGRARSYQVTLPVQVEQADGRALEIFFRPDQLVCASLVDKAHLRYSTEKATLAQLGMTASKLSCARPVELPRVAAGDAVGFDQDAVAHSWELHDRAGTSTLIRQTLAHDTGPVRFRHGKMLGGEPYYLDEFYSVRMLGKQAGWLVKADLSSADPGMFLVTGDSAGWRSRFLGRVESEEVRLSDTRILIGKQMVVDTDTADIFVLPKFNNIRYQVLGMSKDGKHVAIHWRQDSSDLPDGAGKQFGMTAINLESGREVEATVSSLPGLPPGQYIFEFYGNWYRDHCDWTPLLHCK